MKINFSLNKDFQPAAKKIYRMFIISCITLMLSVSFHFQFVKAQDQKAGFSYDKIKFEHLSTDQGLSQSTVECIFRDSRGFMWFGTEEGLNKFDGFDFTVYKTDLKNNFSLNNEIVFSLFEDLSGTLWIGTREGGLNKFNRDKETFKEYVHQPDDQNSISNNTVNVIYESKNLPGILWIGTESGGLNKFDTKTETFTHFISHPDNKDSLSIKRIRSILESPAEPGVLWIGTGGDGLHRFDWRNESFKQYKRDSADKNSLSNDEIWSIYEMPDKPGTLWIGTKSGLNQFEIKSETFIRYKNNPSDKNSISHNDVTAICGSPDEPGVLWIGTMGGGLNKMVLFQDISSKDNRSYQVKFYHYKNEPGNPASLSSNNIISIYEDEKQPGVMWIGTFDSGLNKVYKSKKKFFHYKNTAEDPNSLINNVVWSIFEDSEGIVWIGTHEGLSSLQRGKQVSVVFTNYSSSPGDSNSLSNNIVTAITELPDEPGSIWAATYGGGLNQLIISPDRKKVTKFIRHKNIPDNENSLNSNAILTLYASETEPGILWIGTARGGLNRFDVSKNIFNHFTNIPENPTSLSNNNIHSIWGDIANPDILWLGTLGGGLNKFDVKNESFTVYKNEPEDQFTLSSDIVLSLYQSEDDPGILWVGTAEGGLNKFDIKAGKFIQYTVEHGMPNNIINGIVEDKNGNFWISTNKGLCQFHPKTGMIRNYDVHDGLQANEFNGNAFFESSSGEIFFGGMNGFNAFIPNEIKDNPNIPSIVITDFKIFNHSVSIKRDYELSRASASEKTSDNSLLMLEKSITETDEIVLSYKHNFFSFEFASLDFSAPNKNQYAYKMEGFDDDWIYTGNRRYASYTNLNPGEYIFTVKGTNNDGIWNEAGTSLKIIITPPFWKTWWFLTAFWLIVAVSVLGTVRYLATRKLKKKIEKLEREHELEKERIRISRDMHDEVGSNLTEIAILSELVKRNVYKPDEAVMHLNSISGQIAEIIDNISQIIWAINPKNDPLESLISYIRNFAKSFLDKANIECSFEITENIPEHHISAEVRRNVFLVVKEALNNIVKHSGASLVKLHLNAEVDKMEIKIIDDGKGIIKRREHGNGLTNMQKRIEEINGIFILTSEPGKGTSISITVQLSKRAVKQNSVYN